MQEGRPSWPWQPLDNGHIRAGTDEWVWRYEYLPWDDELDDRVPMALGYEMAAEADDHDDC